MGLIFEDEDSESGWDGYECPNCSGTRTTFMDVIADDPDVWMVECSDCGRSFEFVNLPSRFLDNGSESNF